MNIIEELKVLNLSQKIQFILIIIFFVFMIFSMIGWVIELFFRRFVSAKKWINPGLLKGPCLPIYGVGVVSLTAYIFLLLLIKDHFHSTLLFNIVVVLGIGILMTLIELIGGLIFVEKMNIRLWDYSDRKFNYKGLICLEFSLIWTFLGGIFYFFLFNPICHLITTFISLEWLKLAIFVMGIFYGIFIIDLIQSLNLAKRIKQYAKENKVILKLEKFRFFVKEKFHNTKIYLENLPPFSLKEHISQFIKEQNKKRKKS